MGSEINKDIQCNVFLMPAHLEKQTQRTFPERGVADLAVQCHCLVSAAVDLTLQVVEYKSLYFILDRLHLDSNI